MLPQPAYLTLRSGLSPVLGLPQDPRQGEGGGQREQEVEMAVRPGPSPSVPSGLLIAD